MRLMYLPANAAWVFLFGEDLRTASIEDMGGSGRFFSDRKDAVAAARSCGLAVDSKGIVAACNEPCGHAGGTSTTTYSATVCAYCGEPVSNGPFAVNA